LSISGVKKIPWLGFLLVPYLMAGNIADGAADYHTYEATVAKLKQLSEAHPQLAKLTEIGKSAGGRGIWVMTVSGEGTVAAKDRPAVFVGANMAGYHNAGSEAALHFAEFLLTSDEAAAMRRDRTVYVAPGLNPDGHDGFFANPRVPLAGNMTKIDRDTDGFFGEDGRDDLNGDGLITKMRIKDAEGKMIADPEKPLKMKRANSEKGEIGAWKVLDEGDDNDGDGQYNEDAADGAHPNKNFAHMFNHEDKESGLWVSYLPESKAIMDFLLARPQIALAVVYGPANNFLAAPKSLGGVQDTGNLKLEIPKEIARFMGLDPEQKHTIDEIWEKAKIMPMVVQNNLTKDDVAQFLGVGPATKLTDDDQKMIQHFAKKYKNRLEEAGLDNKRKCRQYGKGGFTPWLSYQYGSFAVELDVWGVPTQKKEEKKETGKLTMDSLGKMSSEDFLALGQEKIAAFLKEYKVPEQYSAERVMGIVKAGQMDPAKIGEIMQQMGAAEPESEEKKKKGPDDLTAFVDAHAPWAKVDWTAVTLADGRAAEVGGFDSFIRFNPPHALLAKPMKVHSETILELSENLAQIDIRETRVEDLGADVFRVRVVVVNKGFLPTHTGLAKKTKVRLPVRLSLAYDKGVTVLNGERQVTSEQLAGNTTFSGEWLLKAKKGTTVTAQVFSDQAGSVIRQIKLEQGVNE